MEKVMLKLWRRTSAADGKLGGQAIVPGVAGTWKDPTRLSACALDIKLPKHAKKELEASTRSCSAEASTWRRCARCTGCSPSAGGEGVQASRRAALRRFDRPPRRRAWADRTRGSRLGYEERHAGAAARIPGRTPELQPPARVRRQCLQRAAWERTVARRPGRAEPKFVAAPRQRFSPWDRPPAAPVWPTIGCNVSRG